MINKKSSEEEIIQVFLDLLTAGLWGNEVRLLEYGNVDLNEVIRLSREQSVVGLVAAGINRVSDMKIPREVALTIAREIVHLEQRNEAMNSFIAKLIEEMQAAGIHPLLVKGQGIAQCYEIPKWRASGDIDLLLRKGDYNKAKDYLISIASRVHRENKESRHLGMSIDGWVVELHGRMHSGLSSRIDYELDSIYDDVFHYGETRTWKNASTEVHLLCADEDVVYVFVHILEHFYKGGIGLRQICDWCRLLWFFRDVIDVQLLEHRLREMRLMAEWKALGALAVSFLGTPEEVIPLFGNEDKWKKKAVRMMRFIMRVGNFGHNRDHSYYAKYPYLIRKAISAGIRFIDLCHHMMIFPMDSLRFFPYMIIKGFKEAVRA